MSKSAFSGFFPNDLGALPGFTPLAFDLGAWMDCVHKNMEAFAEVQQLALNDMQAISQRHSEIMSRLVQDQASMARELMNEDAPERKVARQADLLKSSYEQTMTGLRELSEMVNQTNINAGDIIGRRVSASLNEIKDVLESAKKKVDQAQPAAQKKAA